MIYQVNFSRHCSNLASVAMDVARYIKGSLVREGTDDPACQKLHATLDVLSKNLSTDFSPAGIFFEMTIEYSLTG